MISQLNSKLIINSRQKWIDIARGIGIFLVVVGHCINGEAPIFVAMLDIFSLPIFFILSGYLYKPEPNLFKNLWTKLARFMIPFASMSFLIVAVAITLKLISIEDALHQIKSTLWGGQHWLYNYNRYLGPMWFLACLFLTQNVYNFLYKFIPFAGMHIVAVLMLTGAYIYQELYFNMPLPWFANLVLIALPFYHVGQIIRIYKIQVPIIITYIVAIGSLASIFWYPLNHNKFVLNFFGIPIITFIGGIFCSLMVIDIAKRLDKKEYKINNIFEAIGKSSLIILGFHVGIFYMCRDLHIGDALMKYNYPLYVTVFVLFTISTSHLLYILFNKTRITKFLFLGEYKAFSKPRNTKNKN